MLQGKTRCTVSRYLRLVRVFCWSPTQEQSCQSRGAALDGGGVGSAEGAYGSKVSERLRVTQAKRMRGSERGGVKKEQAARSRSNRS